MLEIRGGDLLPGSQIAVWLYSQPTLLGRLVADANGRIESRLDVPAVAPGDHTLEVVGTDDRGEPFVLRVPTEVVVTTPSPSVPPVLPVTGNDPTRSLAAVFVLLGSGLLLVTSSRRRALGQVR